MKIKAKEVGAYSVNCYICYDEATKEAVIVDPGENAPEIAAFIDSNELKPKAIMLTHAHFDHIGAVPALKERYAVPVAACIDEKDALADPKKNLTAFIGDPVSIEPEILFKDGDEYTPFSNGAGFKVIHTPGHTKGGVCYYCEKDAFIFTGDTLFNRSIGRTDLPTGDHDQLLSSIKERLMCLNGEIEVFPGHGPASTIGEERVYNPFFSA